MNDKITIQTTPERALALRSFLAPHYLGHTPIEELVRGLLADVDRAIRERSAAT